MFEANPLRRSTPARACSVSRMSGGNGAAAALALGAGLAGSMRIALGWPRLLGIALLAAGAALTLRR